MVLTLGTDVRQQLGQWRVRLGHVIADEDRDDAVELLSVFLSQYGDGLQDQLHLLQFVGSCKCRGRQTSDALLLEETCTTLDICARQIMRTETLFALCTAQGGLKQEQSVSHSPSWICKRAIKVGFEQRYAEQQD